MSDERFRPRFHFTAPRHWLNDPNGLCWHGGRWHLHYQHNPNAPRWGDIRWGHASSADLATWRDEPVALAPSLAHDASHCFSGCIAIGDDGSATAFYTGVGAAGQQQCAAHSDDLRHWRKHPQPLIGTPPEGVSAEDFRDPFVWREGSGWAMVVGASLAGRLGAVLLYRSADGLQWDHRGPLFAATDATLGTMWECPNLLRFGERWVLTVSQWPRLGALAFVGRLDGDRFIAEDMQVLDGDGSAFAHLAMQAPDGRMLQWAWIDEQRDAQQVAAEGWAGALSVPRQLWLDDEARLCSRPVDELALLREAPAAIDAQRRFSGRHLDLHARFVLHTRHDAGLTVLASPDGRERTRIVWRAEAQRLVIERGRSSIDTGTRLQDQQAALVLAPGEALELRVLVDASVIEVFANGRVVLTSRVYPALSASVHGEAFSDGPADLDLQAWTMRSMHADPHRGLP